MSYKVLFVLNALVVLAVGLVFLVAPATGLGYLGTEARVPEQFVGRFFGFSAVMAGFLLWFAKDIVEPKTLKGLAVTLLIGAIVGLGLTLVGIAGSQAVIRTNGWILAVLFVLSALGYSFMLFLKPRLKE